MKNWVKMGSAVLFALAVVQSAFAAPTCHGTLHFKAPDNWAKMYVSVLGGSVEIPRSALNKKTGYYDFDLDQVAEEFVGDTFALADAYDSGPVHYVLQSEWNGLTRYDYSYPKMHADIACPGKGMDVWVLEDPKHPGETFVSSTKPDIKVLFVLPPDDEKWFASTPMWSPDGTYGNARPLRVYPYMCGWYYAVWMNEKVSENVLIFREDDESLTDAIGVNGWGKEPDLIPMNSLFILFGADTVSFVTEPDVAEAYDVTEMYFKGSPDEPGIDGVCSYAMYVTYYDTDASLHGAFTCDDYPDVASNACYDASAYYNFPGAGKINSVPCIGVTPGIVSETLDPTKKKPTYNSTSGCFVSSDAFDVMFVETDGVNVKHDFRYLPFFRNEYGFWEFDSYYYSFDYFAPTEAFTPLNDLKDSVAAKTCKGDCATAATLRDEFGAVKYGRGRGLGSEYNYISQRADEALGPVENWSAIDPKTNLPYIDLYPVSAGEFANGDEPNVYDQDSWEERLVTEGNQHFCMEVHGVFTYHRGAFLSVRGDDDIWIFVDNKLAIDLGGLHMPAPSYVSLDDFVGNTGKLKAGMEYDFDMFYCDRRTSMSNLRLVTNLYIHNDDPWHTTSVKKPSVAAVKNGQSGFAVRNSARSTLTIAGGLAGAKFAVMDLQGRVVRQGNLSGAETVVPDLMNGSYVVKVGRETRRVNIR